MAQKRFTMWWALDQNSWLKADAPMSLVPYDPLDRARNHDRGGENVGDDVGAAVVGARVGAAVFPSGARTRACV